LARMPLLLEKPRRQSSSYEAATLALGQLCCAYRNVAATQSLQPVKVPAMSPRHSASAYTASGARPAVAVANSCVEEEEVLPGRVLDRDPRLLW